VQIPPNNTAGPAALAALPDEPLCQIVRKQRKQLQNAGPLIKGSMIEPEQICAELIKQCTLLMEPWPEKRKGLWLKIDDIAFQLVIMRKAIDQVGRMEHQIGIRIFYDFFTVSDIHLSGNRGQKIIDLRVKGSSGFIFFITIDRK
jgi:hypothetical protein